MKPQSANEVIEEAKQYIDTYVDPDIWQMWAHEIQKVVKQLGKTMEDKIFILNDDGKHYTISSDSNDIDDAYDRAMRGI